MAKKKYSTELKKKITYNAVQNVRHNASNFGAEAEKAGIGGSTLHKWRKEFINPKTDDLFETSERAQTISADQQARNHNFESVTADDEFVNFGGKYLEVKTSDPLLKQKFAEVYAEVLKNKI
jgi:transposase-like protein